MSGIIVLIFRIFLAISLLGFLSFAIWAIWKEIKQHDDAISRQATPPILLRTINTKEQRDYSFSIEEIIIGRDPTCELQLDEKTISGRHARLIYQYTHWWIEDLGSRNGTFLNDELISEPRVLTNNDKLRIGNTSFQVYIES